MVFKVSRVIPGSRYGAQTIFREEMNNFPETNGPFSRDKWKVLAPFGAGHEPLPPSSRFLCSWTSSACTSSFTAPKDWYKKRRRGVLRGEKQSKVAFYCVDQCFLSYSIKNGHRKCPPPWGDHLWQARRIYCVAQWIPPIPAPPINGYEWILNGFSMDSEWFWMNYQCPVSVSHFTV